MCVRTAEITYTISLTLLYMYSESFEITSSKLLVLTNSLALYIYSNKFYNNTNEIHISKSVNYKLFNYIFVIYSL